jgi:hypothetical protein
MVICSSLTTCLAASSSASTSSAARRVYRRVHSQVFVLFGFLGACPEARAGHRHRDPAQRQTALVAKRARRWRADPPAPAPRASASAGTASVRGPQRTSARGAAAHRAVAVMRSSGPSPWSPSGLVPSPRPRRHRPLPVQRPIPCGWAAYPVLKRRRRSPTDGSPSSSPATRRPHARSRARLREAGDRSRGRHPGPFVWIGGPARWINAPGWRALGTLHLSVNTMGSGLSRASTDRSRSEARARRGVTQAGKVAARRLSRRVAVR